MDCAQKRIDAKKGNTGFCAFAPLREHFTA